MRRGMVMGYGYKREGFGMDGWVLVAQRCVGLYLGVCLLLLLLCFAFSVMALLEDFGIPLSALY